MDTDIISIHTDGQIRFICPPGINITRRTVEAEGITAAVARVLALALARAAEEPVAAKRTRLHFRLERIKNKTKKQWA